MTDYSYFKDLAPKQKLNDLMHKYAQSHGRDYGSGWKELEKRYLDQHGKKLSILKWRYEQDHQIKMTMPVFLEADGIIQRAIELGHGMTGRILR